MTALLNILTVQWVKHIPNQCNGWFFISVDIHKTHTQKCDSRPPFASNNLGVPCLDLLTMLKEYPSVSQEVIIDNDE